MDNVGLSIIKYGPSLSLEFIALWRKKKIQVGFLSGHCHLKVGDQRKHEIQGYLHMFLGKRDRLDSD